VKNDTSDLQQDSLLLSGMIRSRAGKTGPTRRFLLKRGGFRLAKCLPVSPPRPSPPVLAGLPVFKRADFFLIFNIIIYFTQILL